MINIDKDNMGWVYVAEKTSPEDNEVKNMEVHDKNGIFYVEFESCLQSFDVMNRNNRMYEAANVMQCLDTERIHHYLNHSGWFGEMNHPIPKYKDVPLSAERINDIDPERTSHKMHNPHLVGNRLVSTMQTDAGTDAGENLAKKMVQGLIPGFSCRAIARLTLKNNKPIVDVKKVITYDWVLYQSHREAEQLRETPNKFVNKSVAVINEATKDAPVYDDVLVPLEEIFESVGKTDFNVQYVMEAFELSKEDIVGFTPNNRAMIINDDMNRLFVNIDVDSYNKVNNFMRSLKR